MIVTRAMKENGVLICATWERGTPLLLADNLTSPCAGCGCDIEHRPNVPKEPVKVCLHCGASAVMDDSNPQVLMTKTTEAELDLYLREPKGSA